MAQAQQQQAPNTIQTLGELKASGYQPKPIKQELRDNLIQALRRDHDPFKGVLGFEKTVIPDIQRAVLSNHNMILLGLRGQAKTRIARLLVNLLDEYIPIVKGSELNDDPLSPLSKFARDEIAEKGDDTPVEWVHRDDRFTEKLATPDVTVADLIGDVDPIKAASMKLPYSDERVIHYGLVPRSHRGLFVINELPDLQPRIQVALFNILQEGDIQIRGFKLRLPLDTQFIFTANPEDYTNRGTIVTPLKDRIDSQILTHYPKTLDVSKQITKQEARVHQGQEDLVEMDPMAEDLIEQIAFEARNSEYVDEQSGVSARLTISGYENLMSAVERRTLVNKENKGYVRIADFVGLIPSITGKIELVYEGEQEGPANVAHMLIGKAIREQFAQYFPDPKQIDKKEGTNPYQSITQWFSKGEMVELFHDMPQETYEEKLKAVSGLEALVDKHHPSVPKPKKLLLMEFVLHGLAEYSMLSKHNIEEGQTFRDLLSGMMDFGGEDDDFQGEEGGRFL